MQLISFNDTCKISRKTGKKDEYGNFIEDIIYEGPCVYQEGGQMVTAGMVTLNPVLYLPINDAIIEINDSVEVNTESGRLIKSLAKVVRDVRMRAKKHLDITRIELKQATEK